MVFLYSIQQFTDFCPEFIHLPLSGYAKVSWLIILFHSVALAWSTKSKLNLQRIDSQVQKEIN